MRTKEIDEILDNVVMYESFQISTSHVNGKTNLVSRYYPSYDRPDYNIVLHSLTEEEIEYCLTKKVSDNR